MRDHDVAKRRPRRRLLALSLSALTLVAACSEEGGSAATPGSGSNTKATTGASSGPASNGRRSGEVLLLSYNVAGLPEVLSGSEPAINMPQIGPKLNGYDLVLVQESWKTPEPNPLAPTRVYHEELEAAAKHEHRSKPAVLPLGTDPARPEALVADGLNRFSRYPFGEVTRTRWEGCFGGATGPGAGDCLSQKGFSVATTSLANGVEVDVYNLHGEAGSTEQDQVLQKADYEQLATFIEQHSAGKAIILAGDTNLHTDNTADPEHPEGEGDLAIWQRFLERTGLTDVCTPLACADADKIDKAAFRSNDTVTVEPLSREWETDVFMRDDGKDLSDHPPLAVRFGWSTA